MTLALSLREIAKLGACMDGMYRAGQCFGNHTKRFTAAEANDVGIPIEDIYWVARRLESRGDRVVRRRLQLWGLDCAAHAAIKAATHIDDYRAFRSAIYAARKRRFRSSKDPRLARVRRMAWGSWGTHAADTVLQACIGNYETASARGRRAAGSAPAQAKETMWQNDRLLAWLGRKEPRPIALPPRMRQKRIPTI